MHRVPVSLKHIWVSPPRDVARPVELPPSTRKAWTPAVLWIGINQEGYLIVEAASATVAGGSLQVLTLTTNFGWVEDEGCSATPTQFDAAREQRTGLTEGGPAGAGPQPRIGDFSVTAPEISATGSPKGSAP